MADEKPANIQQQIRTMRRMVIGLFILSGTILLGLLLFVPVDERIMATGTISSERDTYLHAPEDGVLKEVLAWEGEKVAKGQPVLQLDDTLHQAELKTIEANMEKARSELEFQKARLERTAKLPLPREFWHMQEELGIARERIQQGTVELERSTELHAKGLLSQQEVERSRLAVEIARSEESKTRDKLRILEEGLESTILSEAVAEIQNAQSALRALETQRDLCRESIERCILRSPEDGVVTLLNKRRPGQRVLRGEDLAHVAHGGATRVQIFAGENQYHRVRPGQRVLMKSMAFDTLRHGYIEGRVVRAAIEPETETEETTTTGPAYRVVAQIEKTPQDLVIGSTVEARIVIQRIPLWKLLLPETMR